MAEIKLRPVTLNDADMLLEWRNAEETREFFFNPKLIAWDEHIAWLQQVLESADRILLIGEQGNTPIGVVRYDINEEQAEIDVYLKPGLYGKGLGTALLQAGSLWLQQNKKNVKRLVAKVISGNIASCKAFTKAGFNLYYQCYVKEIV